MSIRCNEWTDCSLTCFLFVFLKGFDFAKCEVLLISCFGFSKVSRELLSGMRTFHNWSGKAMRVVSPLSNRVVSEKHYHFCCSILKHLWQKFERRDKGLYKNCIDVWKHQGIPCKWCILSIFKCKEVNTATAAIYLKVLLYIWLIKIEKNVNINDGMWRGLGTIPIVAECN